MAQFKPFKAYLPKAEKASKVVTQPFDSYKKEEIRSILANNEESFLHVIVPVLNEHESKNLNYDEILKLGKDAFSSFVESEILIQDNQANFYVYRQSSEKGVFSGFMGLASIDDYLSGKIKKHEETLHHKENLLKQYLETVDIHAEPVYLVFEENANLSEILRDTEIGKAFISFTDEKGKMHELWKISDSEKLELVETEFAKINGMYIADGHHRCAASALYGIEKREQNPNYSGREPFNYFLAAALPESEAKLYEFSRLVSTLNDYSPEEFISKLKEFFNVESQTSAVIPTKKHDFGLYLANGWYKISLKEEFLHEEDYYGDLDPHILNEFLFDPVLNITDIRKDKRVKFIGGKANSNYLMEQVDSNQFKAAFTVFPVSMLQFRKMSDAGVKMPPKSTWFEPKFPNALTVFGLSE